MDNVTTFERKKHVVRVGDGPWSVDIVSTCLHTRKTGRVEPILYVSIMLSVKSVRTFGVHELLSGSWEDLMVDAISESVNELEKRQISFSPSVREDLSRAFQEARVSSILALVRHQAASLIHHIPSSEACRIWSEEELAHVMSR